MKVIFLKDVPRVGKRHDIKEVNDGYAMNFLLPNVLAIMATKNAIAELELRKKEIQIEREVQDDLLMKNLEELKDKVVTLKGKTNDLGHLFSAIHARDLANAMKEQNRAEINESFIILEKPIKEIGEFEIPVKINGKKSSFKLIVEKE